MTHHNQIKELTTWFSNLPLHESIDNKKYKVWSSNPKPHEAQLEDQNLRKAEECHLEEGKTAKSANGKKSGKPSKMIKKS
jgi:hypothetical protein